AQFGVTLLDLLEQPHVLNGNDRLISKGFEEFDLLICKRSDFCAANHNGPNSSIFPQQGCNKHSANATSLLKVFRFRELRFKLCRNITDVNRLAVDDCSAGGCGTSDGSPHV